MHVNECAHGTTDTLRSSCGRQGHRCPEDEGSRCRPRPQNKGWHFLTEHQGRTRGRGLGRVHRHGGNHVCRSKTKARPAPRMAKTPWGGPAKSLRPARGLLPGWQGRSWAGEGRGLRTPEQGQGMREARRAANTHASASDGARCCPCTWGLSRRGPGLFGGPRLRVCGGRPCVHSQHTCSLHRSTLHTRTHAPCSRTAISPAAVLHDTATAAPGSAGRRPSRRLHGPAAGGSAAPGTAQSLNQRQGKTHLKHSHVYLTKPKQNRVQSTLQGYPQGAMTNQHRKVSRTLEPGLWGQRARTGPLSCPRHWL